MSIEPNEIDAAFEKWSEAHLIDPTFDELCRYKSAYIQGVLDGMDKASAVWRGSAIASDHAAILDRIDSSPTVLQRMHSDARRVCDDIAGHDSIGEAVVAAFERTERGTAPVAGTVDVTG